MNNKLYKKTNIFERILTGCKYRFKYGEDKMIGYLMDNSVKYDDEIRMNTFLYRMFIHHEIMSRVEGKVRKGICYFKTKQDVENVINWLNSKIIINKLRGLC
ncbi:MAG: hypothetical protein ACOCP8_06320 [archaeon]